MANTPPNPPVPPVEPVPVAAPAAVVPPAPPVVDPYAPAPPAYVTPPYAPSYATPGYQPAYYGAPRPPQGLSIASMVLGIAGAFFSFAYGLGLFPSIAAIITGHLARKRQPYARGFSLAGIICGYVGLGISVLWILGIIIFVIYVATNPSYFDTGSYGSDY